MFTVTQTPPVGRVKKHEGFDRTANFTSRTKITQELAQVINDGLYYYEEDLWNNIYHHENMQYKYVIPDDQIFHSN